MSEEIKMSEDLPWATMFSRHCPARIAPNPSGFHGRCELKPHDENISHAAERGMVWLRWRDIWHFDSPKRKPKPHHEKG